MYLPGLPIYSDNRRDGSSLVISISYEFAHMRRGYKLHYRTICRSEVDTKTLVKSHLTYTPTG